MHPSPQNPPGRTSYLPLELIDEIVENACQDAQNSPTISAIALTSSRLRIHATKARFSNPPLYKPRERDIFYLIRRLQDLERLITSGTSIGTIPGPAAFVTSLSVQMVGFVTTVRELFDDALAPILSSIFRPSRLYQPTSATRSLELIGATSHGSEWDRLNSRLSSSLTDLICNSTINSLSFIDFTGIPSNLLQGSRIRHLSLGRCVTIRTPGKGSYPYNTSYPVLDPQNRETGPSLETLYIHNASTQDILQLISVNQQISPQVALSRLYRLTLRLSGYADVLSMNQLLENATNLRALNIELAIRNPFPPYKSALKERTNIDWHIRCKDLLHLKTISFKCATNTDNTDVIHRLLGKGCISSSLKEIHIVLSSTQNQNPGMTTTDVLKYMDTSQLDVKLPPSSFRSLDQISISVKINVASLYQTDSLRLKKFEDEGRTYLRSKLPRLSERFGSGLMVSVGLSWS